MSADSIPLASTDSEQPSLFKNAAIAWSMFAGRAALSLVVSILLARDLGPAGRGHVAYVVNVAGLLSLVASAGTSAAMVRDSMSGRSLVQSMYSRGLQVGLAASVVVLAGLGVVALADPSRRSELVVVGLGTVPLIAQASLTQAAGLDNQMWIVTWTTLASTAIYAVGTVVTGAAGISTVTNNLTIWVISVITGPALMAWALRNRFIRTASGSWVALLRGALGATVASSAVIAIWRLDVILVEWRRGFRELGLYSVAVGAAEILVTMSIGMGTAVLPFLGGDRARGDDVVCTVTRLTLAVSLPAAMALGAVSPWAMPWLFGRAYVGTHVALLLLLPGVVCLVLHYPLFTHVAGTGGMRQLTVLGLGCVSFNIASNIVLLRQFDYEAAAAVSTLTYLALLAGCSVLFLRETRRSPRDLFLANRNDLAALGNLVRRIRIRPSRPAP